MADPVADMAALRAVAGQLAYLGIPNLLTVDPAGNVGGWLVEQWQNGYDSIEELMPMVEQLPHIQERFASVFRARERAARGEAVIPLSFLETKQFEEGVDKLIHGIGNFPVELFDTYQEKQTLIDRDFNLDDLNRRVGESWNRVANTTPEVRAYFAEMNGGVDQGDAWLAAFFLDDAQAETAVAKASRQAAVGGTGRRYGFGLNRERSDELAQLGFDESTSGNRFARAATQQHLATEAIGEREDVTEDAVVAANFEGAGGGVQAGRTIARRISARQAAFSGGGGAATAASGVIGLGEGR